MVEHDDEALHRLRASDPATGSHPDLHSLRGRIAAKAPASQGSDRATRLSDDVLRGGGPRAPWVAAAVVAALSFGAGGYALGAQQEPGSGGQLVAGQPEGDGSGDSGGDGSQPGSGPLGDSASATGEAGGWFDDGSGASSGGDMATAEGEASMMGQAYDPGPVRLVAGADLPDSPGTGEVFALVSDEDPGAFLEAWAGRIGFEGVRAAEPEADDAWFPGDAIYDPEGGRMLSVHEDGGGPLGFSFENLLSSPWCADSYSTSSLPVEELESMKEDWARAFGADVPFPDGERCAPVEGEAPTDAQALSAAEDFLATTGLDLTGYELSVADYRDETTNLVQVEGWPQGEAYGQLMVNASVGPDGVVSAYGTVGELTSLGDYPVISAAEAVERYGQREFGMEYGITLAEDMAVGATDLTTMPEGPAFEMPEPTPVTPGMKIPMLLQEKVVTGAELTTGSLWAGGTGPLEVPAWKLTTEDGLHYAVLALADEAIDWQGWTE